MKAVRYTRFETDDRLPAVHYMWGLPDTLSDELRAALDVLSRASRKLVALGWGVDLVAGHARLLSREDIELLDGERWFSEGEDGQVRLRVPREGTLLALEQRYENWLGRVSGSGETLSPTGPLTRFDTVGYSRAVDPLPRAYASFSCCDPDSGSLRAFGTSRHSSAVAGMVRHAARVAAERTGWSREKIGAFILGHGEPAGDRHASVGATRFAYLPIPTIEKRGMGSRHSVGDVRRLIVTTYEDGHGDEIAWAQRTLAGHDLIGEQDKAVKAVLVPITDRDGVLSRYTYFSTSWATVTPVVLPGFDDPRHFRRRLKDVKEAGEQMRLILALDRRIDGLLRKAILQAGFSDTLARHAVLEWRATGFWPGVERADRYTVPEHLKRFPRLHVRIDWRDQSDRAVRIGGPICIGGGRFMGMGLFAAL